MKKVIIGYGYVGKAVKKSFPDALIYDPFLGYDDKSILSDIDVAFISVPTPSKEDRGCDTSIVEEVIKSINAKLIIIRSTVEVNTTKRLIDTYHKNIVFQPEYIGMTNNHNYKSENDIPFVIIGKEEDSDISLIKELFKDKNVIYSTTKEAEMAKYMTNSFLATKVMFCNEIYDLCEKLNIDYDEVKNLWLLDERIGKSHFDVYKDNRGYGGACFPKDMKALNKMMLDNNSKNALISSAIKENSEYKK